MQAEGGVNLPSDLTAMLDGYSCGKNRVGCSAAEVYRYQGTSEALYLKIAREDGELRREHDIMRWLSGKLPVPEIRYFIERDGFTYLLMTEIPGKMSCDCPEDTVAEPAENTVRLLADGLMMLQGVANCPFDNTLDVKLARALRNIENGMVDMADWNEDNDFKTPVELYQWLEANRPPEDVCFTHGDYCLPNVFIGANAVTGFIDVGRGGIADRWQDIALCVRSLRYNLGNMADKEKYIDLLFARLGLQPDMEKIRYYILLDELF